jgi:signal transduction histidine kinase
MSTVGRRHLQECHESIKTTEDITRFMLSTINRCLDYTKASTGLALAATKSTFDLREALQWAISCIRRSKEKHNITLESLSDDICDYIISDQQVTLLRSLMISILFC